MSKLSDYEIDLDHVVGSGRYAKLCPAINKKTEKSVVMKIIEFSIDYMYYIKEDMKKQGSFLEPKLSHKNVATCFDFFIEKATIYLPMQFYQGGSLEKLIKEHYEPFEKPIDETSIFKWSLELMEAIEYLGNISIVHKNIKPSNVLLNDQESILVSDVCESQIAIRTKTLKLDSEIYMAPERFDPDAKDSNAMDIWSGGVIIFELIHLQPPFVNKNEILNTVRLKFNNSLIKKKLKPALLNIFQKDPKKRPNASDVIAMIHTGANVIEHSEIAKIVETLSRPKRLENAPQLIRRENQLIEIDDILNKDNMWPVIYGISGVGKTVLAYLYANQNEEEAVEQVLTWFDASSKQTIKDVYCQSFAPHFKMDVADYEEDELIRKINNKLGEYSNMKFIFIFDNAVNESDVLPFVQDLNPNQFIIMITTRDSSLFANTKLFKRVQLDPFTETEGIDYIMVNISKRRRMDNSKAREFLKNLDEDGSDAFLPIVLYRGVQLLNDKETYIIENQSHMSEIRSKIHHYVLDYLKISQLARSSIEYEVLNYLSISNKDHLEVKMLSKILAQEDQTTRENVLNKINDLVKLGFVTGTISKENNMQISVQKDIKNALFHTKTSGHEITILNDIANEYYFLGQYEDALDFFMKTLELKKSLNEEINTATATLLNNIGLTYKNLGNYDEALIYHTKAYQMRKELYSNNHVDVAISMKNIGDIYKLQNDNQNAVDHYLIALEQYKKSTNQEANAEIATLLYNIATGYEELNQKKFAVLYYLESLQLKVSMNPGPNADVASLLCLIANVYFSVSDFKKALDHFLPALEMKKALNMVGNQDYAVMINNIAITYKSLKENKSALNYYLEALELRKKLNCTKDVETAKIYSDIGDIYNEFKDHKTALDYFIRSLELRRELKMDTNLETATLLNNIGFVYQEMKDFKSSLEHQCQSLKLRRELISGNSPVLATSLYNVSIAYYLVGEYRSALEHLLETLKIRRALKMENKAEEATLMNNIGMSYKQLKEYKKSVEYYLKSIELRKKLNQEKSAEVALILYNIGDAYLNMCDYKNALDYHLRSLEIQQTLHPGNDSNVAILLNNISIIYLKLEDKANHMKYKNMADVMNQCLLQKIC